MRDAVKRPLAEGRARSPARSRAAADAPRRRAGRRADRESEPMKSTSPLDGRPPADRTRRTPMFGLELRADILPAWSTGSWPSAAPARTRLGRDEISRTGKKMYKQKGTGGARHGSAARPQFLGGGRAFGPVVRSHALRPAQEGARAGAAPCAVVQGQGRRADRLGRRRRSPSPRPRRCARSSPSSAQERADHRRRRSRRELRARRPQHPARSTCCRTRASTSTTCCAATPWC